MITDFVVVQGEMTLSEGKVAVESATCSIGCHTAHGRSRNPQLDDDLSCVLQLGISLVKLFVFF